MFEQVGASVVYYNDGGSIGLLIFLVFFWIIFAESNKPYYSGLPSFLGR